MTETINFLTTLRSELAQASVQIDATPTLAGRLRVPVVSRRGKIAWALVPMAALAAMLGVVFAFAHSSSTAPTLGYQLGKIGSQPFAGAQRATLAQASAGLGFSIAQPASTLTNSGNLSQVWYASPNGDQTGGQAELTYLTSGIAVEYSAAPPAALTDSQTVYTNLARTGGFGENAVQTVHGVPALVVSSRPATNGLGTREQPGFVDMVLNGQHIVILGNRPIADIIAIADSIPAPNRVATSS